MIQHLSIGYAPARTVPTCVTHSLILCSLRWIDYCPTYPREKSHDINLTISLSQKFLFNKNYYPVPVKPESFTPDPSLDPVFIQNCDSGKSRLLLEFTPHCCGNGFRQFFWMIARAIFYINYIYTNNSVSWKLQSTENIPIIVNLVNFIKTGLPCVPFTW